MKNFLPFIVSLVLIFSYTSHCQIAQGPAQGTVNSGVVVSTLSFPKSGIIKEPKERVTKNKIPPKRTIVKLETESSFPSTNQLYENYLASMNITEDTLSALLINSFNGINQTNSIPPDPHITVGPNHIIATVNSDFAIWDKSGNKLQQINADSWYQSTIIGAGPFDPKVVYDHFINRWIMVWLHLNEGNKTAYFLISVSDDDNPQGIWYNYATPTHVNGATPVNNWADYQGVGFDDKAIYITSNQWSFDFNFDYAKVRIIPKEQIIQNPAGQLLWWDFWDIRYPNQPWATAFTMRPAIVYGTSNEYPLIEAPYWSSNFYNLYKIINPLTTPSITGIAVSIPAYNDPPSANQLGGGRLPIESGEGIQNEPTLRNGFLHSAHSIANPISSNFSVISYTKIDVQNNSLTDQKILGADNHWHYYPALAVDKIGNVAISYSRSSNEEYPGAFFSTLTHSNSNFTGGKVLQSGSGNYVVDYGSGRNRWGDYTGIWLDPISELEFYALGEYASATNTWTTHIAHLRIEKFIGPKIITMTEITDFGEVEVNTTSAQKQIVLQNFGSEAVTINSIASSYNGFTLNSILTFPIILQSYDTLSVYFTYTPQTHQQITDTIPVQSNDASFYGIKVKATAFTLPPTQLQKLYGISGNGNLLEINKENGATLLIGNSGYNSFNSIAIHPKNKVIYGIRSTIEKTQFYRLNSELGGAYNLFVNNTFSANSISFDSTGYLYVSERAGKIYKLDPFTGEILKTVTSVTPLNSITFDLRKNELWGAVYKPVGAGRDKIVKINLENGDTTLIGSTTFGALTSDLEFDWSGNMFGVKLGANQVTDLIKIDVNSGNGSILGQTSEPNIISISYSGAETLSSDENNLESPHGFELLQNYPNPFNPTTNISFYLNQRSSVKLLIYNSLGEQVKTLIDESMQSGFYTVQWNGKDELNKNVSSGIYFYKILAYNNKNQNYQIIKKMTLIK
jgi:hypothetical protein